MESNLVQTWENFFVATAGSAAALAGLLFVATSINLEHILKFKHLPMMVLEALVVFLLVLLVSLLCLVPQMEMVSYGVGLAVLGIGAWIIQTVTFFKFYKDYRKYAPLLPRLLGNQLPPLAFVLSGLMLMFDHPHGLYLVLPGVFLSYLAGMVDAWVLLLEIKR